MSSCRNLVCAVLVCLTGARAIHARGVTPPHDLLRVVDRYGGPAKLAEANQRFEHGLKCRKGPAAEIFRYTGSCSEFSLYVIGPSNIRSVETDGFNMSSVDIVWQGGGVGLIQGSWLKRAVWWSEGLRDAPLNSLVAAAYRRSVETSVTNFLSNWQSQPVTFQGQAKTFDGKIADVFSVAVGDRTIQYYFDPETLLCIQRMVINPGGRSTFLYSDYRDVNGLPYPFHTQEFEGMILTQEITLDSVQIGVTLDKGLFKVPLTQPIWVVPIVVLVILTSVGAIIWMLIRRKPPVDPSAAPSIRQGT
jgi:hypothetical protein